MLFTPLALFMIYLIRARLDPKHSAHAFANALPDFICSTLALPPSLVAATLRGTPLGVAAARDGAFVLRVWSALRIFLTTPSLMAPVASLASEYNVRCPSVTDFTMSRLVWARGAILGRRFHPASAGLPFLTEKSAAAVSAAVPLGVIADTGILLPPFCFLDHTASASPGASPLPDGAMFIARLRNHPNDDGTIVYRAGEPVWNCYGGAGPESRLTSHGFCEPPPVGGTALKGWAYGMGAGAPGSAAVGVRLDDVCIVSGDVLAAARDAVEVSVGVLLSPPEGVYEADIAPWGSMYTQAASTASRPDDSPLSEAMARAAPNATGAASHGAPPDAPDAPTLSPLSSPVVDVMNVARVSARRRRPTAAAGAPRVGQGPSDGALALTADCPPGLWLLDAAALVRTAPPAPPGTTTPQSVTGDGPDDDSSTHPYGVVAAQLRWCVQELQANSAAAAAGWEALRGAGPLMPDVFESTWRRVGAAADGAGADVQPSGDVIASASALVFSTDVAAVTAARHWWGVAGALGPLASLDDAPHDDAPPATDRDAAPRPSLLPAADVSTACLAWARALAVEEAAQVLLLPEMAGEGPPGTHASPVLKGRVGVHVDIAAEHETYYAW